MEYYANRDNLKGTISSWFWATAPAGATVTATSDDRFTLYPLRNTETGLVDTITATTSTPNQAGSGYVPASASGQTVSGARTKYFYTSENDGSSGYFRASGFTNVESFDTSVHFLTVAGNAHSGRVCEWLGEMGYALNIITGAEWLSVSVDSAGASYTVQENATGAQRVAEAEFLAYSGQSMAVRITQAANDGNAVKTFSEWRPATAPANATASGAKLLSPASWNRYQSGYVAYRYGYELSWEQEEFEIVETRDAAGTLLSRTETATGNTRQASQAVTASDSQHYAGAADKNISGDVLLLYPARLPGQTLSLPLTSDGGGSGGGGSGGNGGGSGGNGGSTGGGGGNSSTGGGEGDDGTGDGGGGDGDSGEGGDGTGGNGGSTGTLPENRVSISFPAAGGFHAITLPDSEGDRVTYESASVDWLAFGNGGISASANPEKEARTGTLTLLHESRVNGVWTARSKTIYEATQSGIFHIVPETLTFPPQGGEATIEFKNGACDEISPLFGDLGFAQLGKDGSVNVFFYPHCPHTDAQLLTHTQEITYTATDGQTAKLALNVEPVTRRETSFSLSARSLPATGGQLTATALYPENESALLLLSELPGWLQLRRTDEAPGCTQWHFDAEATAGINEQQAVFTCLFFALACDHDSAASATFILGNGEGDGSGNEGGNEDGEESPTVPAGETLALAATPESFTHTGGAVTLTATFSDGVPVESICLLIPEEARERITVHGETVSGNTKTWTLLLAENQDRQAQAFRLAVYAGTLAASVQIRQGEKPKRIPAFFREKHFLTFGIF